VVWNSISVTKDRASARLEDGTHAELTLRPDLQTAASQLLRSARPIAGAALLVDVATGELLVYDQFVRSGHPVYDVLRGEAPSASVFKLVTTAALFERSAVLPQTSVCFRGGEREILREHLEHPTDPNTARCAPFSTALGFSRNAVYAQLVTEHLMRDDLAQVATELGFNHSLPFDLQASVGSLNLPYNDLEFARTAAGFQNSSLSPVGAAHLAYTIALGGQSARMRLVRRAGDYQSPQGRELLGSVISPTTAWRLTRMMEVTVHSGTSLEAFSQPDGSSYLKDIRVAGKTGTLQPQDHSSTATWFTGFAPSRNPEVIVTVFLRNDKVWRYKANQVARDLLRVYFKGRKGISDPLAPPPAVAKAND
jgi:cell division protein FtsI/penicillin-binding protein 2